MGINRHVGKKVAIVVDSLHGGGAEKVCILLAQALQHIQIQVLLVVIKPLREYILEPDFPVYYLLKDASARLHKKHEQKEAFLALKNLEEQAGGFDLVLSNLDGAHPIVQAANFRNTWYVVHNSIDEKLKRAWRLGPIKYFRQKRIYGIFNQKNLVAVSAGLRDELLRGKYVKPGKVKLIYNPIDVVGIAASLQDQQQTLNETYILHVGRFARLKRHDVLFAAFRFVLSRSQQSLKLVLLCESSSKLQKLIKKFDLENHVVVAGFQQNPYVWMKNAEVLVLSSEGEGFGLVLAEAMLCGTPVVSTACQHGPAEILGEEFSDYLAPVGDAESLANNIIRALENRPQMSGATILSSLQPQFVAEQYLTLLDVH